MTPAGTRNARRRPPTPGSLRRFMRRHAIDRVALRVTDMPGRWHQFSIPAARLDGEAVEHGTGFDGSSLRGFQPIEASDMLLVPDLDTVTVERASAARPDAGPPRLAVICDLRDPVTGREYRRDPRAVARRAEQLLRAAGAATGGADGARFAADIECYILDGARFEQRAQSAFYDVDSAEGAWNAPGGPRGDAETQPRIAPGGRFSDSYAAAPPLDAGGELRVAIAEALAAAGAPSTVSHHAGGPGQLRIEPVAAPLPRAADLVQWSRYIVRNAARAHGRVATFMPLPMHDQRGSGMGVRQSLWRGDAPLFHDPNGYAGLSQLGRHYAGGLLLHGAALMAFTNPSTNSYRRLAAGAGSPRLLAFSAGSAVAGVRVPVRSAQPGATQVEFALADGTANPYLAMAAMLLAGLDGVAREVDPGDALHHVGRDRAQQTAQSLAALPRSLEDALDALERDHEFLLRGGVFDRELIDSWVEAKRGEVRELRARPTPYEYELYFDG